MKKALTITTISLTMLAAAPETKLSKVVQAIPRASVDQNEPADERAERMGMLEIALKPHPPEAQALLLAKAYKETRLAAYVAAGCKVVPKGAGHCDHGKAATYWQIHRGTCKGADPQDFPDGSQEQLNFAAQCAIDRIRHGIRRCSVRHPKGDGWVMGLAYYRNGNCFWNPKEKQQKPSARAALARKYLEELR